MNRRESLRVMATSVFAVMAGSAELLGCAPKNPKTKMTVYKSPTCGCCGAWINHVRAAGFEVAEINVDDVTPYKTKHGVPLDLASCHTGVVGQYAFEGHVPADLMQRLLREKPTGAIGLAVPGMPAGSPGMEVPGRKDAYNVVLISNGGKRSVYAQR